MLDLGVKLGPSKSAMAEIHIDVVTPRAAPSEPQVAVDAPKLAMPITAEPPLLTGVEFSG